MKAATHARLVSLALAAAVSQVLAAAPAEIVIPGERLATESLTSTKDGTVYVGSVGTGQIFRARADAAKAEPFIQPKTNGIGAVFGVFADEKASTLWACSGSFPPGPPQAGAPVPPPSALYAFDLKSGAPKGKWNMPTAGAFCNDIAVGSDGTAYASDTQNMQVARLKPGAQSLEVWAGADGAFGPSGGVLDGIAVLGDTFARERAAHEQIFSVAIGKDGKAGKVNEVKLDTAVEGPDGMRSFGANALLVAERRRRRRGEQDRAQRRQDRGQAHRAQVRLPGRPRGGDRGRRERVRARGSARCAVRAAGIAASAREALQSYGLAGGQALSRPSVARDGDSSRQPCGCLWIGSTQYTDSGFSAGVMSRFTTTASLSLRTRTHSSGSDRLALISWCGTYGGT
jgi:hypothetical protein